MGHTFARDRKRATPSPELKVLLLFALGLVMSGIWIASRIRTGSDQGRALAIQTLRDWYSGKVPAGPSLKESRAELLKAVPSPAKLMVEGSFPGVPGRYMVMLWIGSGNNWCLVEIEVWDQVIRKCFVTKRDEPIVTKEQRTVKW